MIFNSQESVMIRRMIKVLYTEDGHTYSRDVDLGILYDEWHYKFGTEVPEIIREFIRSMKCS